MIDMNQIFGYQILAEDRDAPSVLFEGRSPVEISLLPNTPRQVRLFAHPDTSLQTYHCQRTGSLAYVWGIPVHPEVAQSDVPAWCLDVIAKKQYGLLKDLLGHFVVIVDDPRQKCVTFVTDILGVRPIFLGQSKGRMFFGSEVWPIQKAGLVKGDVNYDAVGAWLAYGFNCTGGSLFNELHRLSPGAVTLFQDRHYKTIPYVDWESNEDRITEEQVTEDLHGIVSMTTRVILAKYPRVTLALSGGYDSRYLLALSSAALKEPIECTTVEITDEELAITRQVAETVGASHRTIPKRGSEWDLYDEVFHAAPDGFPISKNLNYCIAQDRPNIPMLHGFMGDSLMRGSKDRFLGKYETEWKEDLAPVLQRKHLSISFEMFKKDVAKKIQERSLTPMEEAVRQGSRIGKIFGWADFYYRQRLYISNNFNQHLGITEALIPFYSWQLLNYKMAHDYQLFSRSVYKKIFQRHFPALAVIPHADEMPKRIDRARIAGCVRTWAIRLVPALCSRNRLTLLCKNHCMPRTVAGIAGVSRVEGLILNVYRLYLLEERIRDAGLEFDWDGI
jgi:hypothetical protein